MADKKQHIIYSRADIENYLQGKMSKDAMHSMERAALQNPFLADAIEGYSFADVAISSNHLAEIESQILANKQETKVVALKKKNEWLKIAIALTVFAGLGWISVLLMKKGSNQNIVSIENNINTITNKETEKAPAIFADSTITYKDIAEVDEKSKAQQFKSLDKDGSGIYKLETSQDNVTLGLISPSKQEETKLDDANKAITQNIVSANATSVTSNQFAATNKPSSGPSLSNNGINYNHSVTNNNVAEIASKDIASNKKDLKEADKLISDAKTNIETNSSGSVVNLQTIKVRRDSSLESIPVTAYFSKKQAAKPIAFKLSKEDSLTVPINGWAAFNDYLRKNSEYRSISYDTAYTPSTYTNSKTGEEIVTLEFIVDNNGKPQKIKVTHSVDEETDNKAIELLKNGPKWQASKKKSKGKVSIKF